MKFVTVKDFRSASSRVWKRLPSEREMVVTSNGKPVALLTPLCDDTFEDTVAAIRRAKAVNAMRRMQETSVVLGNDRMSLEEINAVIKESRGSKAK